jgi:hypothetical protein
MACAIPLAFAVAAIRMREEVTVRHAVVAAGSIAILLSELGRGSTFTVRVPREVKRV